MAKNRNAEIAQETLRIAHAGAYTADGKIVDIAKEVAYTNDHTVFISQQDSDRLASAFAPQSGSPAMELHDETTLSAIIRLANHDGHVGVLNFASAKNPGGGFLNGAMAQEESLAAASALYPSQLQCPSYYRINRAFKSFVYTDCAIWSEDVVFFRDDSSSLLAVPVQSSVLTIPGVNFGQVLIKGEDIASAKAAMKRRMKIALAIFADKGCDTIVLGAFGCGVFRNDPAEVALWWHELLQEYGGRFKTVVFSILDRSPRRKTFEPFAKLFGGGVD